MVDVNLSKAVRSNLLSLQSTAASMAKTQERLATGLKVNTALDNPTNFFTASSLNSRASDMASLLDSMSNGIKTIEAADNGLSSITKTVESMQSTLRQARQDKSFKTQSYAIDSTTIGTSAVKTLSFDGGSVGTSAVSVNLNTTSSAATSASATGSVAVATDAALQAFAGNTITLTAGSNTVSYAITGTSTKADLTTALSSAGFTAAFDGSNNLAVSRTDGVNFTGSGAGATSLGIATTSANGVQAVTGAVKTVDTLVQEINSNTSLAGKIRASNDSGKLRIENLSTEELNVTGVGSDGEVDGTAGTGTIGGNDVRKNLVKQFNDLRDQLDKFADDASFNGINLLRGDKLKLTFNETGTSTIDIQAKDSDGAATSVNNTSLGITSAVNAEFDSDASIDSRLSTLSDALGTLRSQSSAFGSNLSIVQNRTDFTKKMINTLETGAANLTLADTNAEAANLLALQTRQQLSSTALSMASQADQAVLRLF
ncbi:MAG: flagellar protein [Devosia sp.]|uniref:flagellin N-terminal helical domain-containing protein n=1 Tax=Devosia sp. TaxID=1871048 RepID=UPI001AC485B1|nr:flagellin [Devosia sp.]MBN9314737.1 flagellar protein [Devosia sp.]